MYICRYILDSHRFGGEAEEAKGQHRLRQKEEDGYDDEQESAHEEPKVSKIGADFTNLCLHMDKIYEQNYGQFFDLELWTLFHPNLKYFWINFI
jgi:hypothetical protein